MMNQFLHKDQRRGLTLLESLAAVVLLTIIIAALLPLLRSASLASLSLNTNNLAIDEVQFNHIADAFIASPESFSLDLRHFGNNPTEQTLAVPPDAVTLMSTSSPSTLPTTIAAITLRPMHTFINPAGRFVLVELSSDELSQRRILRVGDLTEEELDELKSRGVIHE